MKRKELTSADRDKNSSNKILKSSNPKTWNFDVDYNDHFETPFIDYNDIKCILVELASILNKPIQDLIIYDPYWCQGNMIKHLQSLGFHNIINSNRDFYKDIKQKQIPGIELITISYILKQ